MAFLMLCLGTLYATFFFLFRKCIHGTCTNINGLNNNCICELGWRGEACDECRPYCDCPNQKVNACMFPNECHCEVNNYITDPKGLCITILASTGKNGSQQS